MSADEGEGNAKVNSICNDDVETAPFLAVDGSEALRSRRRVNQIGEQSLMRFANRKHLMPQHHHSATQPSTGYTTIGRAASIDDGFDDVDTGEYYYDDTNDQSWTCSFGTKEDDGIWMVRSDPPGTMMSIIVWILIGTCIVLQFMQRQCLQIQEAFHNVQCPCIQQLDRWKLIQCAGGCSSQQSFSNCGSPFLTSVYCLAVHVKVSSHLDLIIAGYATDVLVEWITVSRTDKCLVGRYNIPKFQATPESHHHCRGTYNRLPVDGKKFGIRWLQLLLLNFCIAESKRITLAEQLCWGCELQ